MAELETVDLEGVEILEADVTIHGIGSPPSGDRYSTADLQAMATAAQELEAAGEWRIPAKIGAEPLGRAKLGHGKEQKLLDSGELPAAGWLSNQRVSEDGTKLLADVKDVPRKVGDLIKAKAYKTRSSELGSVKSQKTGKNYDWVVTGLAWLGGKMPAVRTLDDVVALYEHDGLKRPDARVFVVYATGDVVWDPEAGFEDLRSDVNEALNGPGPTNGTPRFWVMDIATTQDKALVQQGYEPGDDAWVVPFTRAADDTITIAPSSDWVQVEQGWLETAREMAQEFVSRFPARADIRRVTDEAKKYTDDQRRKFSEALAEHGVEVEAEDVTDEQLAKAGVAVETTEPPTPPTAPTPPPPTGPDAEKQLEQIRKFEERAEAAEKRAEKIERRLFEQARDAEVEAWLRAGKAAPGQRDEIVAMYEEAPERTRKFFENAPVNEHFARAFGVDSDELTDEEAETANRSYEEDAAARLGIPKEAVL